MKTLSSTFAILILAATFCAAQTATPTPTLSCEKGGWRVNGLDTFCTVGEYPAVFTGALAVSSANGSVTLRGWDNPDLLVRAKIQTAAENPLAAQLLAAAISVGVVNNAVKVSGPPNLMNQAWSVAYEIFLPHSGDLTITIANGSLNINDVKGHIQFTVANGSVTLNNPAGQVEGKVANGAVTINLGGDHWDGQGMNVKTSNGSITANAPHEYSAHFDASTTLGSITTNYPVHPSTGKWGIPSMGCTLSFDAGMGGATIQLAASLGQIRIEQAQ